MKRRTFLYNLISSFIPLLFSNRVLSSITSFRWAQLKFNGDFDPVPGVGKKIVWELTKRTSIDADTNTRFLNLSDPEFFYFPFLSIIGKGNFPPLTSSEREILRKYILYGGFLFIDDVSGKEDSEFYNSIEREIEIIIPGKTPEPINSEHVVYKSFYLIKDELLGVDIDSRCSIIISKNLSGRIVSSFATRETEYAIRMGINIIMYSLTTDYKTDQIHQPFIKRRLR